MPMAELANENRLRFAVTDQDAAAQLTATPGMPLRSDLDCRDRLIAQGRTA